MNDMSKEAAEIVQRSGQAIMSIEENVHDTNTNIKTAVGEIKTAKDISESSGGMLNKAVYIVLIIVAALILLSWMMPK
jgi:hypothetical protein